MNDLTGQKFGKLIVIKRVDNNKWGSAQWLCRCDCGIQKIICGFSLAGGNTRSCGCLYIKHGHCKNKQKSQIYHAWEYMIQRCTNPKNKKYKDYGGRGIIVCKRWMKFENFLNDIGEPSTTKHTLDRIDNDRNYCKENCRWATRKEQQRNKRNNRLIIFNGKTQCLIEWAEELNINYKTLQWRLNCGWSIEKALTTPVQKRKK